jgi:hypothetical protein
MNRSIFGWVCYHFIDFELIDLTVRPLSYFPETVQVCKITDCESKKKGSPVLDFLSS